MRGFNIGTLIHQQQKSLYSNLNEFADSNNIAGRLGAIPVALLDSAMDIISVPLNVIEQLAFTVLNLIGAAFIENLNIKDGIRAFESALISIVRIPVTIVIAPSKLVYQIFHGVLNPGAVLSF